MQIFRKLFNLKKVIVNHLQTLIPGRITRSAQHVDTLENQTAENDVSVIDQTQKQNDRITDNDLANMTLWETEEQYHWADTKEEQGELAWKISQTYFTGRTEYETDLKDPAKHQEWFLTALNLDHPEALWQASLALQKNNSRTPAHLLSIKDAMKTNGYKITPQDGFIYEVKAALLRHQKALANMSYSIENPKSDNAQRRLAALKALGYEPSKALSTRFLVDGVEAGNKVILDVRKRLKNPVKDDDRLLQEEFSRRGIIPDDTYFCNLMITPAFKARGWAGLEVAKAIFDSENPESAPMLKILKERDVNPTSKLAVQFQLNAAINGDKNIAYMASLSLLDNQNYAFPELKEEMINQKLKPDSIMGNEFKIISAFANKIEAVDYCAKSILLYQTHPISDFSIALQNLGLEADDTIKATFLNNCSPSVRDKISKHFKAHNKPDLLGTGYSSQQRQQIKKEIIQNFKTCHSENPQRPVIFEVEPYRWG